MAHPPPARLRDLEVSPAVGPDTGAAVIVLRDPLGVSPEATRGAVRLGPLEWAIARRLDGRSDARSIAQRASVELETQVADEEVRSLAARLSGLLLLHDASYDEALGRAFELFRKQPERPALGPGKEYESDAFELRLKIGGMVADDWDMPPLPHAQGLLSPAGPISQARSLYSRAFASVRHAKGDIARVLLLANLGAPLETPLVPLVKPFQTPLGLVEPDREALAAIGLLPGRDQLAHALNPVLERQCLFCRVLFPGVPVLPILVSAPRTDASTPAALNELERAIARLGRLEALPGRTLTIAAADLYRIGSANHAGLAAPPDRGFVLGGETGDRIRSTDRQLLDHFTRLDPEAFLGTALEDSDPVRARHAAAPYVLLRLLEKRRSLKDGSELLGSTMGYLQMPAPGEVATAAAVVLH